VWNGLLQKLWEQSANPKKYGEPTDVDVDLKANPLLFRERYPAHETHGSAAGMRASIRRL
jgi:hypothetical protein